MRIIYSQTAVDSLKEIVDYLNDHWTDKEMTAFEEDYEKFLQSLKDGIITYPNVSFDKHLRFTVIAKRQVKIYFDLDKNSVEILLFFASKDDPEKLKKLLK